MIWIEWQKSASPCGKSLPVKTSKGFMEMLKFQLWGSEFESKGSWRSSIRNTIGWKPIYNNLEFIVKTAWHWELNRKY